MAAIGLRYWPHMLLRQGCMFSVKVNSVFVKLGRKGNKLKFVGIIASQ